MGFGIGRLFHVIHVTDDVDELDAWYGRVFGARRFLPRGFSPVEKRDASIVCIADVPMEPMAPAAVDGAAHMPVGRFWRRFGRHLHSLAWYVDDIGGLYDRLVGAGVRVVTDGGAQLSGRPAGSLFTHPRDTGTQLEFFGSVMTADPRFHPGWDARWWARHHPLGIEGLAHVTVVTREPARLRDLYVDVLGGLPVGQRDVPATGARESYVLLGDTVVAFALPTRPDTLAALDLARHGQVCHSVTFRVRDLAAVRRHLGAQGVGVAAADDDTLLADPADTFGAVLGFTTRPEPA